MYQFTILYPHHLFTNARTKCCSSGIPDRGLHKEAWVRVAKGGKAGLNIALVEDLVHRQSDLFARANFSQKVEDLVDRQSDLFARATFSQKVEDNMKENGDYNEANFCRL